ncbi:MAG: metallophosphoesterase [Myxococcota bacterium]|nr:metallophosphoesterase [Myxococcota bacterium]
MKSILHIADLHFGTEDPAIAAALVDDIAGKTAERPTLVVISGDLTQRARKSEYRAARAFLDALPVPYVVVPGNHDVPLYNLFARFFRPLDRYRDYIGNDLTPTFFDDDLAVIGIATAHGFTAKNGKIDSRHLDTICRELSPVRARWKVLVAHHPFVVPAGVDADVVDGAAMAIPRLEDCGVDVILTGHMHVAYATDAAGYRSEDRRIISMHAGTCMSTRTRGEVNGYNRLVFDGDRLSLTHRVWDGARFVDGPGKVYRQTGGRHGEDVEIVREEVTEGITPVPST